MKTALITGITGQDGSYLAEFLLKKGYKVFGLVRRLSTPNLWRIEQILDQITLLEGDLLDQASLNKAIMDSQPDEVYNLAAQSFVATSWKQPGLTSKVTGLGCLNVLESIKNFSPKAKFYQASSSEMYGNATENIQDEQTKFCPRSPYAISKLYAHWISVNYRESYGLFVCSGILFNHESPRRGIEFVTRKITDGVAKIKLGLATKISLGNLDARRDWGYAGDYVEAMWLMLQQAEPKDYVISTGETHSVRDFVIASFQAVGIENWQDYVEQDPKYMRPAELHTLKGSSHRAFNELGWKPKVNFQELVEMMVNTDLKRLQEKNLVIKDKKIKCLVTGISGFVGEYLTRFLLEKGYEIYGLDRLGTPVEGVNVFQADLLDREKIFQIITETKPDQIIHLAAQSSVAKSWENPDLTMQVNVEGTQILLDAVRHAKLNSRILVVTSAEIYGVPNEIPIKESHYLNPTSPYGKSRLEQERLIKDYKERFNMDIVISRSFPHTGPGQSKEFVCSSFAYQITMIEAGKQEPILLVGNLEAERDFMDVRDVVRAYYLLINSDTNEVYNVCSGQGVKVSNILKILLSNSKVQIEVKQDPARIRPNDIPVLVGNNVKILEFTGWKPNISFEQTLIDILNYWRTTV
jgi:GDPmannose 4,6-dehydratase